jgi:hypothetical protein
MTLVRISTNQPREIEAAMISLGAGLHPPAAVCAVWDPDLMSSI